ncbi:hypothetical protein EV644_115133 [Kribbella orskensis]|uniref:Uncharacterized protein n=1 Tax=Kribbella orskensis TaxID=2512216 RepID=A0ABY2BDF8_9ACTN|nr:MULTISPECIES: hypothetical protein [Kribbella]TCN35569.1 hypothetical protein EV642_116133 [Kribbella sp. VKM Ac-2500]TCO17111.1 hypothetical protein EV644_115133 [Kribbella orskensis]
MTVHTKGSRRPLLAILAAVAVVAVGGCDSASESYDRTDPTARASVSGTPGVARDLVRLRYKEVTESDAGAVEIIADGNRRYRMTVYTGPEAGSFQVWDGDTILTYNLHGDPKYQRQEQPNEDEFPRPTFFFTGGTEAFRQTCPNARRLGPKTVLGRSAVRYACDKVVAEPTAPIEPREAREIALDEQTGLMLQDGPDAPAEVTFGPPTNAGTFSTSLPPGVEATPSPGGEETAEGALGGFLVPAVGGGHLDAASYRGKPVVVVTGPADGIRTEVARLLPMTAGGKKPAVIGLLIAIPPSDWKGTLLNPADVKAFVDSVDQTAGRFAVPVGIDVKGAAGYSMTGGIPEMLPSEPGYETSVAIAMVNSIGDLARVTLADEVDDAELRGWLAGLS